MFSPSKVVLRVQYLSPQAEATGLPAYATAGAAGLDLRACLEAPLTIAPGAIAMVPTGLAVEIPAGLVGLVFPRSGLASKFGISLANAVGVIDSDYRGELRCPLINHGEAPYVVNPGERVAQLVLIPFVQAQLRVVTELGATARGSGGFGSTGK